MRMRAALPRPAQEPAKISARHQITAYGRRDNPPALPSPLPHNFFKKNSCILEKNRYNNIDNTMLQGVGTVR